MTLAELSVNHQRRFDGIKRLYGAEGADQIMNSHIVVVGVGGVGSWSAEALARNGVSRITLIDMDHISESNINRQIHALDTTLGQAKIVAMRQRIHQINPGCIVHTIDDFVTPENWSYLASDIRNHCPITGLIDACDQVSAKTALAVWALAQSQVFSITIGAAGGKQQAELVQIHDLSQTTHDPLLAKLRYNLRRQYGANRQGKLGVTCVYSAESVQLPKANTNNGVEICQVEPDAQSDGTLNCHGFGSSVSVTATFGLCAVGWLMRQVQSHKN